MFHPTTPWSMRGARIDPMTRVVTLIPSGLIKARIVSDVPHFDDLQIQPGPDFYVHTAHSVSLCTNPPV